MSTTRAIVFDAFGTLIRYTERLNPYRHLLHGQQRTAGRAGRRVHPFMTRDVPLSTFAAELGAESRLDEMQAELARELAGLRLFPEVDDVLAQARAAGLRVGLCSNLAREYGPAVRRLVPGLDASILSYEAGVTKPDPEIYRLACDGLGCAPAEVVFVGDSRRCDFEGPRAFGMQARWLNRRDGQSLHDALAGVI